MRLAALIIPVSVTISATLILAGCAGGPYPSARKAPDEMPARTEPPRTETPRTPPTERFACENGLSVYIRRLGGDRVDLALDDQRARMTRAVSGSGERYVSTNDLFGRGAEWHQKADEGFLSFVDPYGNRLNTVCRRAAD